MRGLNTVVGGGLGGTPGVDSDFPRQGGTLRDRPLERVPYPARGSRLLESRLPNQLCHQGQTRPSYSPPQCPQLQAVTVIVHPRPRMASIAVLPVADGALPPL